MVVQVPEHSLSIAEIDLGALRHNFEVLSQMAPEALIMPVVKANAYGHGVDGIVAELEKLGAKIYCVATLDEAISLRQIGIKKSIVVLASPLAEHLEIYSEYQLDLCVGGEEIIGALCQHPEPIRLHINIDTGMRRLGVSTESFPSIFRQLKNESHHDLIGLMSHFTSAETDDSSTELQLKEFGQIVAPIANQFEYIHIANSAGLAFLGKRLQEKALVRLGIALFGYGIPSRMMTEQTLIPVMTLKTRITAIRNVQAGESVSYGKTWMSARDTNIATAAIGYADGYPRSYSNWAQVSINGQLYPLVGRVCMDMLMIDLGPKRGDITVGDEVILFGKEGPFAEELSKIDGSIPYELVTGISARVKKVFITGD